MNKQTPEEWARKNLIQPKELLEFPSVNFGTPINPDDNFLIIEKTPLNNGRSWVEKSFLGDEIDKIMTPEDYKEFNEFILQYYEPRQRKYGLSKLCEDIALCRPYAEDYALYYFSEKIEEYNFIAKINIIKFILYIYCVLMMLAILIIAVFSGSSFVAFLYVVALTCVQITHFMEFKAP